MTKERLAEKIKGLLKADIDLDFLLILKKEELERLVACIRDRVDPRADHGIRMEGISPR